MLKKILLSCFAIFGLTFLLSSNSYAASDLVHTFNSSDISDYTFCSSSSSCSDYHYLYLETNLDFFGSSNLPVYYSQGLNCGLSNASAQPFIIINSSMFYIPDVSRLHCSVTSSYAANFPSDWFITLTFSDSNPFATGITPEGSLSITSNGTYDVTNYASAVVNISTELPPYSQIVVDSFWKYHVAIAGGLASIFAIFIVYRIIRSRLR